MDDNLSLQQMAGLLGVSTKTVAQLVREGLLRKSGRGKYALGSVTVYIEHLRQIAGSKGRPVTASSELNDQRTRLAKAQADEKELKAAALRGELINAAATELEWADVLRRVRSGVLSAPSRVRQRLPHLTAADAAEIDAELRDVLTEIAND